MADSRSTYFTQHVLQAVQGRTARHGVQIMGTSTHFLAMTYVQFRPLSLICSSPRKAPRRLAHVMAQLLRPARHTHACMRVCTCAQLVHAACMLHTSTHACTCAHICTRVHTWTHIPKSRPSPCSWQAACRHVRGGRPGSRFGKCLAQLELGQYVQRAPGAIAQARWVRYCTQVPSNLQESRGPCFSSAHQLTAMHDSGTMSPAAPWAMYGSTLSLNRMILEEKLPKPHHTTPHCACAPLSEAVPWPLATRLACPSHRASCAPSYSSMPLLIVVASLMWSTSSSSVRSVPCSHVECMHAHARVCLCECVCMCVCVFVWGPCSHVECVHAHACVCVPCSVRVCVCAPCSHVQRSLHALGAWVPELSVWALSYLSVYDQLHKHTCIHTISCYPRIFGPICIL